MPGPGGRGRAAARAGQRLAGGWARLRCAERPGPGTDWASPCAGGRFKGSAGLNSRVGLPHHEGLPSSARFSSYVSLPCTTRLHSDEGAPCRAGLPRFTWLLRCAVFSSSARLSSLQGSAATWDFLGLPRSSVLRSFPAFAVLKGPGGWASSPCPWFLPMWIPQKCRPLPVGSRANLSLLGVRRYLLGSCSGPLKHMLPVESCSPERKMTLRES